MSHIWELTDNIKLIALKNAQLKSQKAMATKVKLSKRDETLIDSLDFDRDETETVTVRNPYSGDSCQLDARGVALHDFIKGAEALGLYNKLEKALTLFRKLYPSEYYTLLD